MMADYLEPHCCMKDRQLCTITPNYWLQHVASNQAAPAHSRACAARSLLHNARLHGARQSHCLQHAEAHQEASHGIVPSYMHREILDSPDASDEQKDRAKKSIEKSSSIRAAREVFQPPMTTIQPKRPFRVLYDSEHTDELPGNRIRTEMQTTTMDIQASNVWDSFGNTFEFSYEVFGRNSIDDLGMSMVGSVHFDDELPPPGYDNAFWDGKQMVFGDGDAEIFEDFTRCPDVIAHELTHGVTEHTANLPYYYQSGALNESISDVFGSMVKQWIKKETAEEADWLIGEGIFHKDVGAYALRSMKAPGTAYKDTLIGSDRQPAHMNNYVFLPATEDGDQGGVHINSGIPNRAFYLVAIGLGGYSWDAAGKIWFDALTDPALKEFAAIYPNRKRCFPFFAELTVKHAANYTVEDKDVVAIVVGSWHAVGIVTGSDTVYDWGDWGDWGDWFDWVKQWWF